MSEVVMLRGAESKKILQTIVRSKSPAIVSYASGGKWHVAKVLLTDFGPDILEAVINSGRDSRPFNIGLHEPVGISVKHGYGKFIFETTVINIDLSSSSTNGGKLILATPSEIELVQRRSYFRVEVPKSLEVSVQLWHRRKSEDTNEAPTPGSYRQWSARLIDISAGGTQVAIEAEPKPDFRQGQFISMSFTPMPYEKPIVFDAQIRNILPTADENHICLGLQMVGLEASAQGREVLSRLVHITEQYHQMNQSGTKQQDFDSKDEN